jgi:predicted nucleic acid-binding protein
VTHYFLDSSAIVKRYLPEVGTPWIRQVCDPGSGDTVVVSEVTVVEVAAALAARHRASGGISRRARDNTLALFLQHFGGQYEVIAIRRTILDQAVELTQHHRLRGYDAVQLSAAQAANDVLLAAGLAGLIFVAADTDLVAAARAEGLIADDPNLHR